MRAIPLLPFMLFTACASFDRLGSGYTEDLDSYELQNGETDNDSDHFLDASESIELISEAECFTPCTFKARTEKAAYIIYSSDDWVIGRSEMAESDFSISYDFEQLGPRLIKAEGFDANDHLIGEDELLVQVDKNSITLLSSAECDNPCTFKADVSGHITRVQYFADDWSLGNSTELNSDFEIEYDFFTLGNRAIEAVGYNAEGVEVASDTQWVSVLGDSPMPNVPYYYQFANSYNPSGSCQNTSIAMLLGYYGYTIFPDNISNSWGTSYAQSPSGLASLFNYYANQGGIPQRLTPVTNGTINGLKSELDAGRPVIVHGYFTSYGHIMVVLGYDDGGYWVNDPAGEWAQYFGGGYPYGWESSVGKGIYYRKDAFEAAVATSDGYNYLPLWYHLVR